MNNAITLDTRYNTDEIRQELRGSDDIRGNVHEHIMNLRDQGVREALKQLGWTPPGEEREEGGWPPPINKACEYRDAPNSEWCQGVCVGYYNNYAVVVDEGIGGVSVQIVEHVRPLRTAEQKAVDKIHAVIMALPDDTDTRVAAQDIYKAIRDGDVPGVGLMGGEA